MKRLLFIAALISFVSSLMAKEVEYSVVDAPTFENSELSAEIANVIVNDTIDNPYIVVFIDFVLKETQKFYIPPISRNTRLLINNDASSEFKLLNFFTVETEEDLDKLESPSKILINGETGKSYTIIAFFDGKIKKGEESISFVCDDNDASNIQFPEVIIDNPLVEKQSTVYIAYTKSSVNFREEPSLKSKILSRLGQGTPVVVDIDEIEGDFYKAYDFENGITGYISKKYISLADKPLEAGKSSIKKAGRMQNRLSDPEVTLKNSTDVKITVKFGKQVIVLKPRESKTFTCKAGMVKMIVSTAEKGIRPYYSTCQLQKGYLHSHNFYIRSELQLAYPEPLTIKQYVPKYKLVPAQPADRK